MSYPKKFMSRRELKEMGFPDKLFYQVCKTKGSPAFKSGTGGRTSQWLIDTDLLDQFLQKQREKSERRR